MEEEAPSRGPAPLQVLDNRDVPTAIESRPIQVRTFEGDKLLREHTLLKGNTLGQPSKDVGFESLEEVEAQEPGLVEEPQKSNALDFSSVVMAGASETVSLETPRPAPALKPLPQIEVTFIGAFGEITAPFSSAVRQGGVVVLGQAKNQSFKFTPKRTEEDETFSVMFNDGVEIKVSNPGIAYDRTCPCCGVKERCIVLIEIHP